MHLHSKAKGVDHLFFDLLFPDPFDGFGVKIKLAAIGPVTAKTLAKNGLPCDVMPDEYTIPALVQALVDTYN